MNPVIDVMMKRKSVRAYEPKEIEAEVKAEILKATLRAPTAGNMMLYSIVDVTDQAIKDKLAITCDHQPFIAKAPMVWMFLADYQRWFDYFIASDVETLCRQKKRLSGSCRDSVHGCHGFHGFARKKPLKNPCYPCNPCPKGFNHGDSQ